MTDHAYDIRGWIPAGWCCENFPGRQDVVVITRSGDGGMVSLDFKTRVWDGGHQVPCRCPPEVPRDYSGRGWKQRMVVQACDWLERTMRPSVVNGPAAGKSTPAWASESQSDANAATLSADCVVKRMRLGHSLTNRGTGWWLAAPTVAYQRSESVEVDAEVVEALEAAGRIKTSVPYISIVAELVEPA